jgi:hypothetical protein
MATYFSRARKGEPGGAEMTFAGAPSWASAARENTIGFDGALLSAVQNRSGRQKVSSNRSAALPRNGNRNGHPVTTNHVLSPRQRRKTVFLLPIAQPNCDFLGSNCTREGAGGSAGRHRGKRLIDKPARNFIPNGAPAPCCCSQKKCASRSARTPDAAVFGGLP